MWIIRITISVERVMGSPTRVGGRYEMVNKADETRRSCVG